MISTFWCCDARFPHMLTAQASAQLAHGFIVHQSIAHLYADHPACRGVLSFMEEDRPSLERRMAASAPLCVLLPLPLQDVLAREQNTYAGDENAEEIFLRDRCCAAFPLLQDVCAQTPPPHWKWMTYPAGFQLVSAAHLLSFVREHGPWEQQQTHHSLLPYLQEETAELTEAIEEWTQVQTQSQIYGQPRESGTTATTENMVSELGDVLLQVLFHGAIGGRVDGKDAPHFTHDDIAQALVHKLCRRMPYLLSEESFPSSVEEQDALWHTAKKAEHRGDNYSQPDSSSVSAEKGRRGAEEK